MTLKSSSNLYSISLCIRQCFTFICAAFKSHAEWNYAYVSTSATLILPTTVGTFHSLDCFSHVINCKLACIQIFQNFWFTPEYYFFNNKKGCIFLFKIFFCFCFFFPRIFIVIWPTVKCWDIWLADGTKIHSVSTKEFESLFFLGGLFSFTLYFSSFDLSKQNRIFKKVDLLKG